eukprot:TRINITY_DN24764_c0_g1_i2.p1 TRINITY_DN24764_c0_g1~~TRINITY_DN24764_c0_g1_i2.p1  ORF type:complete len:165 (-),score=22.15 TRINITY_DN24764_c0_g1_i2:46-540(-)
MENEDDSSNMHVGTKCFMSPETFSEGKFSGKSVDIWASGVTLYYFMTGKLPFFSPNPTVLRDRIVNADPDYPPHFNSDLIDLLKGCLIKDPAKRITLNKIMSHPWVTNNGKEPLENNFAGQKFEITEADIKNAVSVVKFRATITLVSKMQKKLKHVRQRRVSQM